VPEIVVPINRLPQRRWSKEATRYEADIKPSYRDLGPEHLRRGRWWSGAGT